MKKQSSNPVVMMLMLMLPLLLMQGFSSGCIDSERDALFELKMGIIGKSDYLSSWSGENCCDWDGVECNGVGHAIELTISLNFTYRRCSIDNDIRNKSFTDRGCLGGEISPSLLNLKYLERLDLSNNMFSGTIPSNIGMLNHLTYIDLSQNNFTGPIPTSIGLLSSLRWLDISDNRLSGHIPTSIGLLSSLQNLSVYENHLNGHIPTSIGLLSSLQYLDVSDNRLNGHIPTSIGKLSKLVGLFVYANSLTGTVSELHFAKLASLNYLDMRSNKLTINVSHQWVPPFQLLYLNFGYCMVGPEFPSWLQTQTSLYYLNLSSTGISGTMPGWFEENLKNIDTLDLSKNEIRGKVPEVQASNIHVNLRFNKFESLFKHFPTYVIYIDVSNNLLSGQFPPYGPPVRGNGYAQSVYIFANNNLTGPIPDYLCGLELVVVDLSSNQLSGELNSCFGYSKTLQVLDLSNNNLHGQIPSDFGYGSDQRMLSSLHLSNNRFHGKLPLSLQNFNNLRVLDLSKNAFTGSLPWWFPTLTHLKIVNLQSNNLYGQVPETLCKLKYLQLLHLGQNNITGTIPHCFGNFTAMTTNNNQRDPLVGWISGGYHDFQFQEHLEAEIRGINQRYTSTLPFLISMDLSSNNIVGNIPPELMNLLELKSLNLSRNHLKGKIPTRIGNLKNIESLDLSENNFSGEIPSSLSGLTFISHLNLSFNNLSGRIPTGNQLQTLEDSSIYMGNNQLCGIPLKQICPGHVNESSEDTEVEDDDSFQMWFYAGSGMGFVVGLLGFCSVLFFKSSWRHAYFLFIENGWNWLYVQIAVKKSLLQKQFQKRQTVT